MNAPSSTNMINKNKTKDQLPRLGKRDNLSAAVYL